MSDKSFAERRFIDYIVRERSQQGREEETRETLEKKKEKGKVKPMVQRGKREREREWQLTTELVRVLSSQSA